MRNAVVVLWCVAMAWAIHAPAAAQRTAQAVILYPRDATFQEQLAAKEVRRYVYLRTGQLLDIKNAERVPAGTKNAIVLGTSKNALLRNIDRSLTDKLSALKAEQFLLRTITAGGRTLLVISGGDGTGTLYGAYRFAERLGMAFELDGDVVPDRRIPFALPVLDETSAPLFRLRGIQPFHDFPEGPDWWETDDYLAIIAQLPKMGMNFFGLHTYPEEGPNAEPTVWIGREGEWNRDGSVRSAYSATYQNTLRARSSDGFNWGYRPKKTSEYSFGAGMLFDRDDYGSEIMRGLTPEPATDAQNVEVFNRTGAMLRKAFSSARQLGVRTCVGTETYLTVPKQVKERLMREGKNPDDSVTVKALYKGMFGRIVDTYPLDYYWFWTPEGWTWEDAGEEQIRKTMTDLSLANQAAHESRVPFQLATCGWVLGPPKDRGLFDRELPKNFSVSCINREVGKAPVDPAFSRIDGRSRWAIPWMEDDPSLLAPQLWAGRTRKDAADALSYGCDGLLGIHWRTRILSPNFMALARAAWDQKPWNKENLPATERRGPLNGTFLRIPDSVRIVNANDPEVYRTVRDRVFGYRLEVPNGTYRVTLQFCDDQSAGRRVFDVLIQGKKVVDALDIAGRAGTGSALDLSFDAIPVTNGVLNIDFADRIGFPAVAGIVIEDGSYARRVNCGGPAYGKYEADEPATPRALPVDDLYREWALGQFGAEAADATARIFASMDSRLPEPSTWITGPGNVKPDERPWVDVEKEYAFVDSLQRIRPLVRGKANLERFDFWLNSFLHMKGMAKLGCLWGKYNLEHDRVLKPKPIPSSMLIPPSESGHGLLGQYYNDTALRGDPVATRLDSAVTFRWERRSPCEGVRADSFSVRWTGALVADASGPGRLGVINDDGARLWVDGRLIADHWAPRGTTPTVVDFTFEAGRKYDIRLEYFDNAWGAELHLVGGTLSPDSVRRFITSTLFPLRREMIETIHVLYGHLLATVTNTSELGTIANWEQHNFPVLLDDTGAELEKLMGSPLPEDMKLPRRYEGPPRIIVPTVRTMAGNNETLNLKVLILSGTPPMEASIQWRPLGSARYESQQLKHVSRGVYGAALPVKDADLEYYVAVKVDGQTLHYPATAPEIGQTVVIAADESR